jgi:hypothetical protein
VASIFDRSLIYVTGKGGVGRSTVCAALGLAAAERGRQTLVCELAEQDRLSVMFGRKRRSGDEENQLTDGLWGLSIDPQAAIRDWLAGQLGSRTLSRPLVESNAFNYFAAAAPGAREMATMVRVWELAEGRRRGRGQREYDLVIVDAPASGHGLGMVRTPRTFGQIARVGPIRRQTDRVGALLADSRRSAYLAVALAEEMPVSETLELEESLEAAVGVPLSTIVANGIYPRRFSAGDMRRLSELSDAGYDGLAGRALAAARTEHGWAAGQQAQLRRLRRQADTPVLTLPFLFSGRLRVAELERLAGELGRKLSQA